MHDLSNIPSCKRPKSCHCAQTKPKRSAACKRLVQVSLQYIYAAPQERTSCNSQQKYQYNFDQTDDVLQHIADNHTCKGTATKSHQS